MISKLFGKIKRFWIDTLWQVDTSALSRWQRWGVTALRTGWVLLRDLLDGQITLRAMSLVYTTLLAIVPLLAVSFSVLKGFGVHNLVEPMLLNLLQPLGPKGVEISARIIDFVDNIQVGVLGVFGLALLLYTAVSMVQKIEAAFNEIWHVTETRPLGRRFSDYLSVILIGPVLMFTAVGAAASFSSSEAVQYVIAIQPLGVLLKILGTLIPYLLVICAFTFIYIFVPNTRVSFKAAGIGALVAGVLWATLGWAFAAFVTSSSKYAAIYSAFATLIFFMIWLYVGWLILLIGSKVAFYFQNPQFVSRERGAIDLSNRQREILGLAAMLEIARAFDQSEPAPDGLAMVAALKVPPDGVAQVIAPLAEAGLISGVKDPEGGWVPGRALRRIGLDEVLRVLRSTPEDKRLAGVEHVAPAVSELVADLERSSGQALQGRSVQDLL